MPTHSALTHEADGLDGAIRIAVEQPYYALVIRRTKRDRPR
jgi:hypothetical protein